jgi:type I restriction enzyme S subunit
MKKIKTYSDYSTFDQHWLGKLPSHWKVMRTKLLFDLITEPAPVGNTEELLSVYTAIGVKPRKELEARGNKASSTDNYWRVKKGDIIVNKLLAWMGAIGISEYNGVTSPAYDILRPKENVNPYFYNYLFRNIIASREFKRHSRGIMDMRLRLYFTRFGDVKLPFPSIIEQNNIVNYLEYKQEKIERFISKKKQLISVLTEQKSAIINQAVTKGINPNSQLKPSGIKWLGDIPEHWEAIKLTGICGFVRGNSSFKKDELLSDGNYVALQYGKTYKVDEVDEKFKFYVNDEFYKDSQVVNFGDVIIVSTSETIEDLGHSVFYNRSDLGLLGGEQMLLKPNNIIVDEKYLYYSSKVFTKGLRKYATGVKVYRFNKNDLKTIYTSVPPIQEQKEIVNFIEAELDKINKTISTIEKEIDLVEEYKTALIAEAVTGKIDVRDFKASVTEESLAMVAEEAENYNKAN